MDFETLKKLIEGAKARNLATVGDLAKYCDRHGLKTNEQKVEVFCK